VTTSVAPARLRIGVRGWGFLGPLAVEGYPGRLPSCGAGGWWAGWRGSRVPPATGGGQWLGKEGGGGVMIGAVSISCGGGQKLREGQGGGGGAGIHGVLGGGQWRSWLCMGEEDRRLKRLHYPLLLRSGEELHKDGHDLKDVRPPGHCFCF
jgi:hypothetical protein